MDEGFTNLERAWSEYCRRNETAYGQERFEDSIFSCCIRLRFFVAKRLARHRRSLKHVAAVYGVPYSVLRRYGERIRRVGR
jgi:hypothetical protein